MAGQYYPATMIPWLILLAVACPKGRMDSASRLAAWLRSIDVAWADRAARGLQESAKPLLKAWQDFPDEPEIQWRLVRLKVAEGLAEEDETSSLRYFADGRALGLDCLDGNRLFEQRRGQGDWASAAEGIQDTRIVCAAWTGLAWTRWMTLQGGGATTLDLDAIDALHQATQASQDPQVVSVHAWSQGLVLAARPLWAGGDLAAARIQLQLAIEIQPEELARRVDLLLLVASQLDPPDEVEALRRSVLDRPAKTPEDLRARARAEP